MRFPVEYRGRETGFVEVQKDGRGIAFDAACTLHTQAVLRLYALGEGAPVRIGVLEPGADGLRLTRHWTRETMRSMRLKGIPSRYYLEDGQPGCIPEDTKQPPETALPDCPLAAAALQSGAVAWEPDGAGGWLTAPFVPGQAHPLAFALTACVLRKEGEGYVAALRWPEDADPLAKS